MGDWDFVVVASGDGWRVFNARVRRAADQTFHVWLLSLGGFAAKIVGRVCRKAAIVGRVCCRRVSGGSFALRVPLSTFHFPFSVFHFPFSIFRFPFSV
jgi:hypothetical protein